MSKNKALAFVAISILIVVAMLICLPPSAYGCMIPFAGAGCFYGVVYLYLNRQERPRTPESRQIEAAEPPDMLLPPMTSKGSNGRLFIPAELPRKNH